MHDGHVRCTNGSLFPFFAYFFFPFVLSKTWLSVTNDSNSGQVVFGNTTVYFITRFIFILNSVFEKRLLFPVRHLEQISFDNMLFIRVFLPRAHRAFSTRVYVAREIRIIRRESDSDKKKENNVISLIDVLLYKNVSSTRLVSRYY